MRQKIIRAGRHSLAVIVPAAFVHSLGVKAGDTVEVHLNIEKGTVRLKFAGTMQLHLPRTSQNK